MSGCVCACVRVSDCMNLLQAKRAFLNFWILYFNFKKSCKINCLCWEEQGHWTTKSSCLATQKTHFTWGSTLWRWRALWITSFDDHDWADRGGQRYSYRRGRGWAIFSLMAKNCNVTFLLIPGGAESIFYHAATKCWYKLDKWKDWELWKSWGSRFLSFKPDKEDFFLCGTKS